MRLYLKTLPRLETPHQEGNCVQVGFYHVRNISAEALRRWENETGERIVEVEFVAYGIVEIVDEKVPDELLKDDRCEVCETRAMLR